MCIKALLQPRIYRMLLLLGSEGESKVEMALLMAKKICPGYYEVVLSSQNVSLIWHENMFDSFLWISTVSGSPLLYAAGRLSPVRRLCSSSANRPHRMICCRPTTSSTPLPPRKLREIIKAPPLFISSSSSPTLAHQLPVFVILLLLLWSLVARGHVQPRPACVFTARVGVVAVEGFYMFLQKQPCDHSIRVD